MVNKFEFIILANYQYYYRPHHRKLFVCNKHLNSKEMLSKKFKSGWALCSFFCCFNLKCILLCCSCFVGIRFYWFRWVVLFLVCNKVRKKSTNKTTSLWPFLQRNNAYQWSDPIPFWVWSCVIQHCFYYHRNYTNIFRKTTLADFLFHFISFSLLYFCLLSRSLLTFSNGNFLSQDFSGFTSIAFVSTNRLLPLITFGFAQ